MSHAFILSWVMSSSIILFFTGIVSIAFSFVVTTKNLLSSIFFKVIPFFWGLILLLCAIELYNIH